MCILIFKPADLDIPDSQFDNCNKANPHGCGFAYINTSYTGVSKIKIEKSMTYEVFLRKYHRAVVNNPESPFIIHFRYATHGTKDRFNCHPFKVNKNLCMAHNGVIYSMPVEKERSDTQVFNDEILKKLPRGWEINSSITFLIEKFLNGSKMITMDIEGNVNIYNEKAGHWNGGIWYSNNGYKKVESIKPYSPQPYVPKSYAPNQSNFKATEMYMCDGCLAWVGLHWSNFFDKEGEPTCYCNSCKVIAIHQGDIRFNMGISRNRYDTMCDTVDNYTSYVGRELYEG